MKNEITEELNIPDLINSMQNNYEPTDIGIKEESTNSGNLYENIVLPPKDQFQL